MKAFKISISSTLFFLLTSGFLPMHSIESPYRQVISNGDPGTFISNSFGQWYGTYYLNAEASFIPGVLSVKKNLKVSGDTTTFQPNTNDGWGILSVYINQDTSDSVEFELILEAPAGKIKGPQEQFIGTITNSLFLPKKNQVAGYVLLPGNTWNLIINKNGQCYLAQELGSGVKQSNLPANPDVLPIKVRYKLN